MQLKHLHLLGKGGVTFLRVWGLRHLQNRIVLKCVVKNDFFSSEGKRKLIFSYLISSLQAIYIAGVIAKEQKQITKNKGQITKNTNIIIPIDSSASTANPITKFLQTWSSKCLGGLIFLLGLVVLCLSFTGPSKNILSSRCITKKNVK